MLFDASGADDEEFFSAEEDGDHWTEHAEQTENSSLWKAQPAQPWAVEDKHLYV